MDEGTVTPIRRGDRVATAKRSQTTEHLPPGATIAEVARSGKVSRAKRRADVLTLAMGGHTAETIAELLTERYQQEAERTELPVPRRMTKASVESILRKALTDFRNSDLASIESVRTIQLQRLDELLAGIYVKARQGNTAAIDRVLRIEQLRAKIAGTEAPRKVDVSGHLSLGLDPADVQRDQEAWVAAGGDDVIDLPPALPAGE